MRAHAFGRHANPQKIAPPVENVRASLGWPRTRGVGLRIKNELCVD